MSLAATPPHRKSMARLQATRCFASWPERQGWSQFPGMIWVRRLVSMTLLVLVAATVYLGLRVFAARGDTRALIDAGLQAAASRGLTLSPERRAQLLAVEDPTFLTNDGLDFFTPGQGWTTLTQSLAKQLYFPNFTPGIAKIELMAFARFALTPLASKDEILTVFLAGAYFGDYQGRAVNGFDHAARIWFDANLEALTEEQFLSLVAMLVAPNRLDPMRNADALRERVRRIKALLSGRCAPSGWTDVMLDGCAAP